METTTGKLMEFMRRNPLKAVTDIQKEFTIYGYDLKLCRIIELLESLRSSGLAEQNGTGWELSEKGQDKLKNEVEK